MPKPTFLVLFGCDSPLVKSAKKSYEKNRKYLDSWEKLFPWLSSVVESGSKVPFCKLCRKSMRCHLGTIEKHAIGISHKKSINAATHNRKIARIPGLPVQSH